MLQFNSKMPALQYGLGAYPLNKTDLRSFDFSVNRLQTIMECESHFGFLLPIVTLYERSKKI